MARPPAQPKQVTALTHPEATRTNIPTAEYQPLMQQRDAESVAVHYQRTGAALQEEKDARNPDLDPQLVWRGKDQQDWSDLVVQAPPLYIQEKVHPKALIDDLLRASQDETGDGAQASLFGDFNGLPEGADKTDFYSYDANWQNRMILGDSLQVMASLAEREGLRGQVQCIYLDPPYGIKFNSNFQWSTTSRDVRDGNAAHITREPEQVKAFRDTWRDGIHSYLTYLRDRLTVARDLLTESGSIFVQIGDENVHRVRAVMDEVFGDENLVSMIAFQKTSSATSGNLGGVADYLLWYARNVSTVKFRRIFSDKDIDNGSASAYSRIEDANGNRRSLSKFEKQNISAIPRSAKIFRIDNLTSQRPPGDFPVYFNGNNFRPGKGYWKTHNPGFERLKNSGRVETTGTAIYYVRYLGDFPVIERANLWTDTVVAGFASDKTYVVETSAKVVQRCILMASDPSDPGDLVLDPTCGSGTTAYVAEQWGRRWITIDTSRVALALARARIMGARYPYYLLADSPEGQQKEAEITRSTPKTVTTHGNIRHGFVYERVPHIMLKDIANNAEIDVIWEQAEEKLAPLREQLTGVLPTGWLSAHRKQQAYTAEVPAAIQEWEVPRQPETAWPDQAAKLFERVQQAREAGDEKKAERDLKKLNDELGRYYTLANLPQRAADPWPEEVAAKAAPVITKFWKLRIARQKEIDASIAAKSEFEYLYDKPYENRRKVRVAGPFTVESLSPHRMVGVDEDGDVMLVAGEDTADYATGRDFAQMILENLKTAGVQQAHKDGRIRFSALTPWPGEYICAEGRYAQDAKGNGEDAAGPEVRAGVFIGPEFGTVSRPDLVAAAREAADVGFDVLIACAFSFDAHATDFDKLGRVTVLKARMNADLHMAEDLKNTGQGNLFVIFGEPDIDILKVGDDQIRIKVNGVDVFKPQTGEIVSDGPDGIACWFVDTDYNQESFFVRHAYFLGASDPYKSLKTTLKAEINPDAWETLHRDTSRPFPRPETGRIAVKIINHLGDEVMKVFRV